MSKKLDATQSGVSDTNDADTEQPQRTSRDEAMELLANKRREQLAGEGVVIEATTDNDEDLSDEEKAAKAAEAQAQIDAQKAEEEAARKADEEAKAREEAAAAAAAIGTATDQHVETALATALGDRLVLVDGKPMVKTKVDGEETLEPFDKVLASYQKGGTADKRLEEATRILEEARAEREAAKTDKERKEADRAVAAANAGLAEAKKKFLDAVYDGNRDDAATALDQIINDSVTAALKGREPATPDEAAIIAKVTPAVEQSLETRRALKQFQKDYPKIAQDPYLASRADAYLKEALDAGKAIEDAFKDAGEKTLGWMRETLGIKSEVTVSTTRTERTEKKRDIDNPRGATARTVTRDDSPVEGNNSATIAKMREGRVGTG